MVFALIIGAVSYGIYLLSHSAVVTISVVAVILVAAGIIGYLMGMPGIRKNIEQLK